MSPSRPQSQKSHESSQSTKIMNSQSEPEEDDEGTFEVEEVVDKKVFKNVVYYKIKWKGYSELTWEPAKDCNCPSLIKEYEQRKINKSTPTKEDEWEVDKILEKQVIKSKVYYLVRWRGWPGPATWVPAENCDCVNLIAAFENPKLRKLWNHTGCNTRLWLTQSEIYGYMRQYKRDHGYKINIIEFEPNLPDDEEPRLLKNGINIAAIAYENHWYLVIFLVNHLTITKRIMIADALNVMLGVNPITHPLYQRLKRLYEKFTIKPINMSQQTRSDMCAFYILAAYERVLFLLDSRAPCLFNMICVDETRAELIRSEIKPETHGEISASLPIQEDELMGLYCEFCNERFSTRLAVDNHIRENHFIAEKSLVPLSDNESCHSLDSARHSYSSLNGSKPGKTKKQVKKIRTS